MTHYPQYARPKSLEKGEGSSGCWVIFPESQNLALPCAITFFKEGVTKS